MTKLIHIGNNMHPADIKAALEKKGLTLSGLALANGFLRDAMSEALRKGRPDAEKVIADALDTTPQLLFPKRFNPDGSRKLKRAGRPSNKSLVRETSTKPQNRKSAEVAGAAV